MIKLDLTMQISASFFYWTGRDFTVKYDLKIIGYLPFVCGYSSRFHADLRFQRLSIHPSYARFSLANAKKSVPLLEALFFNLSRIHVVILSNVYFFFNDFFFNDIAISIYAVSIRYVVVTICTI